MADKKTVESVLLELAAGLRRVYGERLVGVYLFGSWARGDATEHSDIDVAVVLKEPVDVWQELKHCSGLRAEICLKNDVCVNLTFLPRSRFKNGDGLGAIVRAEGVPL